jgi:hypothetical protein
VKVRKHTYGVLYQLVSSLKTFGSFDVRAQAGRFGRWKYESILMETRSPNVPGHGLPMASWLRSLDSWVKTAFGLAFLKPSLGAEWILDGL